MTAQRAEVNPTYIFATSYAKRYGFSEFTDVVGRSAEFRAVASARAPLFSDALSPSVVVINARTCERERSSFISHKYTLIYREARSLSFFFFIILYTSLSDFTSRTSKVRRYKEDKRNNPFSVTAPLLRRSIFETCPCIVLRRSNWRN